MQPSNEEWTEESSAGPLDWLDFERRPLLKALGGSAALSFGSGVATAQEEVDDDEAEIDPEFGYPTTDATDIPAELEPDHEVQMLVSPPAGPGQPPFLYFEPTGLRVDPGDIVQFTAVSPDHTVTAYHPGIGPQRRVPEESPPFSSPVLGPGGAWLYRFEHEGVYDVYCAPHHILGMAMRLVVGELDEEDLPEYVETVEGVPSQQDLNGILNQLSEQNEDCEWPFLMPADVLGSSALDPITIQAVGEMPFEAVLDVIDRVPDELPERDEQAPAGLASRIESDGQWAVWPDDPALWRRSETPIDLQRGDGRWLAEPADGSVRCRVENDGDEALANAGFYFDVGPIGDVDALTVESESVESAGDAAQLLVGVYLDVSGDGDYFEWERTEDDAEQFAGLGGDEEGIAFPLESDQPVTVDEETEMLHLPSEAEVTFGDITAGEVGDVEPDTAAALQVSVMGAGADTVEEVIVEGVAVERS